MSTLIAVVVTLYLAQFEWFWNLLMLGVAFYVISHILAAL